MMKEKERPTKEHLEKFDLTNACSGTECTGLVTHFATEDELESYMDIYSFQATPYLSETDEIEKEKNKF